MKRIALILIVLTLTLIIGSAAAAGNVLTGRFFFSLPDNWYYEKVSGSQARCCRIIDGKEVATFTLVDVENKSIWPDSPDEIAELLKEEAQIEHNPAWEEIEVAGQKTANLLAKEGEAGNLYLTAVNGGSWHASVVYTVLKGYEIDQELESILDTVTARDPEDAGYFRFGDAYVRFTGAKTKKVGSSRYILLNFNWRNVGQDTTMFAVHVDVTAFQDGVQLQDGYLFDVSTEETTMLMPGKSIDVTKVFQLRGNGGQLDFTVDKLLDFDNQYMDRQYSFILKEQP